MRKIIYSILHVTAAVFCIFLAAAAVCGCSGDGRCGRKHDRKRRKTTE